MKESAVLLCSLFIASSLPAGSPPVPVAKVVNEVRVPEVLDNPAGFALIAPDGTNATAILDASASSDPDGDPLQFEWGESDEGSLHVFASGVRATKEFDAGGHSLGLTAYDGSGSATDRFILMVWTPEQIATVLIDVMDDDALPGKPRRSLRKPLEEAVKSFEGGDTRRALHELRVFLRKTKKQPPSPDPVRAAGVRQLTRVLIETVGEK